MSDRFNAETVLVPRSEKNDDAWGIGLVKTAGALLLLAVVVFAAPASAQSWNADGIWYEEGAAPLRQYLSVDDTDLWASTELMPNARDLEVGFQGGDFFEQTLGYVQIASGGGTTPLYLCNYGGDRYLLSGVTTFCPVVGHIWTHGGTGRTPLYSCSRSVGGGIDIYASTTSCIGQILGYVGEIATDNTLGFNDHARNNCGWSDNGGSAGDDYPGTGVCQNPGDPGCPLNCDPAQGGEHFSVLVRADQQNPGEGCPSALWEEDKLSVKWTPGANLPLVDRRVETKTDLRIPSVEVDQECGTTSPSNPDGGFFVNFNFTDKETAYHPDAENLIQELRMNYNFLATSPLLDARGRATVFWAGKCGSRTLAVALNVWEDGLLVDPDCGQTCVDNQDLIGYQVTGDPQNPTKIFVKMTGEPWGLYLEAEQTWKDLTIDWYQILDSLIDRELLSDPTTCTSGAFTPKEVAVKHEVREPDPANGTVVSTQRFEELSLVEACYGSSCLP